MEPADYSIKDSPNLLMFLISMTLITLVMIGFNASLSSMMGDQGSSRWHFGGHGCIWGKSSVYLPLYGIFEGDGYSKAFIDYRMCELKSCE